MLIKDAKQIKDIKQIKVAHILTDVHIGGAGRYLINLLQNLDPQQFQSVVLCPAGGQLERQLQLLQQSQQLAIRLITYPQAKGDRSLDWSMIWWFYRALRREKPQVVHTHASLSGRLAARLAGIPASVMTRHWSLPTTAAAAKFGLGRMRQRVGSWINSVLSDAVIAVSQSLGEQLVAAGLPRKKVVVIHNGINVEEPTAEAKEKNKVVIEGTDSAPIIGTVGRLEPEKGFQYFLEAASTVRQDFPQAEFWLIGAGSQEVELKQLAGALQLGSPCKFLGFRPDAAELVEQFDLYVLSSLTEALPLALLEAMAKARPVIATRVGGVPEIVEHQVNGWLIEPGDAAGLAQAISYLLQHPQAAQQLGQQGQKTVLTKFNARLMAQKTAELYQSLLRSKL